MKNWKCLFGFHEWKVKWVSTISDNDTKPNGTCRGDIICIRSCIRCGDECATISVDSVKWCTFSVDDAYEVLEDRFVRAIEKACDGNVS